MSDESDRDNGSSEDVGILPFDDGSAGRLIRRVWHDGRWFFSVIDVVAILTESDAPAKYWTAMKARIQNEGFHELSTFCRQLKMRALDGKMRETDTADAETMLRITMSIPSPKAEPIRQWLAQVGAQTLDEAAADMTEAQKRLLLRGEVAAGNRSLNDAARDVGVLSGRDFAVFHDWGYKGLYGGETARGIADRKGVRPGEILDHMNSNELAMNWLRITQTDEQLRKGKSTGDLASKADANATHFAVGREIRGAVERIGGTLPEHLPTPAESIQQLEQAEQQRVKAELQPPLLPSDDSSQ